MLQRLLHPMSLFIALLLIVLGLLAVSMNGTAASATDEPCVPKDAWTEVIEHPEVSHLVTVVVVDEEAYDEEVFDHWQRYSWTGGPLDDAPTVVPPHPDWQPNVEGDPHGIGSAGAYFVSHGNSGRGSWFYLEEVTRTVHYPAVTHEEQVKVVDKEAWTETIEHPAIVCPPPTTPPTPTETPSTPTETPTVTETPSATTSTPVVTETPVVPAETSTTPVPTVPAETPTETPEEDKPDKDKPGDSSTVKQSVRCKDGAWLTEVFTDGVLTSTSSAGTCGEDTRRTFSIGETG